MADILHLHIYRGDGGVGCMHLLEGLDVGLVVLAGQQLRHDDAQALAARCHVGTLHVFAHRLLHLLASRLVLDAAAVQQAVVHLCRALFQMVAVDEEQSRVERPFRASRAALLVAGAPGHHGQHLLARTDILPFALQTGDLGHSPFRLLRRLEGGEHRRGQRLRPAVGHTVEITRSPHAVFPQSLVAAIFAAASMASLTRICGNASISSWPTTITK